ncbi:hypothetical protein ARMSODRAFT_324580 [Armillaria solidipes]|uniref:Uncharacterized protein n=1 Tax=Armillaria solidipes TaxID=1076256 RepID=A0A2H3BEB7_9AGAR|nr:hypothetical protein ARMSODRAFT_324580 [Armillaria solidipes]
MTALPGNFFYSLIHGKKPVAQVIGAALFIGALFICLLISLWFCFYRRRRAARVPLRQRAYTPLPTRYFPRDVVLYIARWYPPAGFGRAAERLQQPLPVYHPSR